MRHGHAEHNINSIMNGDPSNLYHLTEIGKKQISEVAKTLKNIHLDVIFTSEMIRAIETANIINKDLKILIKTDSRLNDLKSGVEGKTYIEYKEKQKQLAEEQNIDSRDVRINNGESFNDEKQRIHKFLDDLQKDNYQSVLIVAHFDSLIAIDEYLNKGQSNLRPEKGKIYKFEI